MISSKQLQEFKSIYKEQFGESISDAYAIEIATQFIELLKIVYKPMAKEEYNELVRRNPRNKQLNKNIMKSDDKSEKEKIDEFVQASVDSLNKNAVESVARGERYDKIFAVERTKWSNGMGSKKRDEIPENLQKEFDECITRSQNIAREACQTEELTNAYLSENSK